MKQIFKNHFVSRVFLLTLLAAVMLFVSPTNILASEEEDVFHRLPGTLKQTKAEYEHIVEEGHPSLEVFVHSVLTALQHNGLTVIVGPTHLTDAGSSTSKHANTVFDKGAIPSLTSVISEMYTRPPASFQAYLADVAHSARIIPTTQAQGLGFASLDPILTVWKTFRNVAYFFFVLVFIVIGFMIMLRHKIGGQTPVTIEQAIPNIIVALLFVTFSYAIAGLMIDIMYLTMYIMVGLFEGSSDVVSYDIFRLGATLISEGTRTGADSAIQSLIDAAGVPGIFEWITSLTIAVILGLAMLFGIFKLFFELLKSYVSIILSVAFAPIFLMIGAIPGQNTFNKWFRTLTGNLAAFPAVLLLLLVQKTIQQSALGVGRGGFMPPFLLGSGVGGALPSMVAIGMLLAMPEIVKKIKESMGATEGVFAQFGQDAWNRFGRGAGLGRDIAQRGFSTVGGATVAGMAAHNTLAKQPEGVRNWGTVLGALGGGLHGAASNVTYRELARMTSGQSDAATRRVFKKGLEGPIESLKQKVAEQKARQEGRAAAAAGDAETKADSTPERPVEKTNQPKPKLNPNEVAL